ncbi:SAM-dependent methyltransferase [Actinophytocola sediminis]
MSTERPNWAPESIDLDRPNAARVYDYLLGGAANFAQDRVFAEQVLEVMPQARTAARLNRAYLRRAVHFCVESGIRQFIDIGSGIPTAGNVHEIAKGLDQDTRVLYVDSEPVAVTHSELILRGIDNAEAIRADLTDPDSILGSDAAARLIDFSQPVAVLMVAVLHFIPDSAEPHQAVARYVDAMAPGSHLVVSHAVKVLTASTVAAGELYDRSASPGVGRTPEEITAFFTGTELVPPGLLWTTQWRPESPDDVDERPEDSLLYAGVGRKP